MVAAAGARSSRCRRRPAGCRRGPTSRTRPRRPASSMLTRHLAAEFGPQRVRLNCVAPSGDPQREDGAGSVWSRADRGSWGRCFRSAASVTPDRRRRGDRVLRLGRLGWITGATLDIAGGKISSSGPQWTDGLARSTLLAQCGASPNSPAKCAARHRRRQTTTMLGPSHALSGAAGWLAGTLALSSSRTTTRRPIQIAIGTAMCAGRRAACPTSTCPAGSPPTRAARPSRTRSGWSRCSWPSASRRCPSASTTSPRPGAIRAATTATARSRTRCRSTSRSASAIFELCLHYGKPAVLGDAVPHVRVRAARPVREVVEAGRLDDRHAGAAAARPGRARGTCRPTAATRCSVSRSVSAGSCTARRHADQAWLPGVLAAAGPATDVALRRPARLVSVKVGGKVEVYVLRHAVLPDLRGRGAAVRHGSPTDAATGSTSWCEQTPRSPACWQELGLPGLADVHTHFLPPRMMRRVWAHFDEAGPLIGRRRGRSPTVARRRSGCNTSKAWAYGCSARSPTRTVPTWPPTSTTGRWRSPLALPAACRARRSSRSRARRRTSRRARPGRPDRQAAPAGRRLRPARRRCSTPVWGLLADDRHAGRRARRLGSGGPRLHRTRADRRGTGSAPRAGTGHRPPRRPRVPGIPGPGRAVRAGRARHDDGVHRLLRADPAVSPALLGRLRELGLAGRVLLGSDFPNIPYPYAHQLDSLARLDLGDDWLRAVCWHNAARLFPG